MDAGTRNRRISNGYYNRGLERAKNRDLTGAVEALKKSLRFNKYHTDARNLLGLVYNEIGEVAAALAQWIISLNFQERDNRAEEYLRRLEDARGYLETADQAAKKYNQALGYAYSDNEDLAVLLLMRLVEEVPNYLKAQRLLALLYIHHEDYTKAGRCLYQALKVDRYNPDCQRYMAIVKQNTGRAEVERRKLKNAFSHRQMQDDDIILPPTYKENTGWQSVLNILAGLVLGAAVIFFLVMPASREALGQTHNEEARRYLEQINQLNLTIDGMQQEVEDAKKAREDAQSSLDRMVDTSGGILSQYQRLVQMLDAYRNEDLGAVARIYVETDFSVLADGVLDNTVTWLQRDMADKAYVLLAQMGDEAAARAGGAVEAIDYYQKSLTLKGDNPEVIYKLGLVYQGQDDTAAANQYFGDVIMNYPNSEYVALAKEKRGY